MNQALPRAIVIDEPAEPDGDTAAPGFGFQDFLSILFSQRIFMACIFLAVLAAGAFVVTHLKKSYLSQAAVAVGTGQAVEISRKQVGDNGSGPQTEVIESEIEILRSNDLMIRLIKKLKPEFVATQLQMTNPASYAGASSDSPKLRELVRSLQASLLIERQQSSSVLSIGVSAPSPEAAVLLANSVVDAYLESKIDERRAAAERAGAWLNDRVAQLAKTVEAKEAAVAAYRAEMRLLSVDGATLTEQQYYKLQGEVVAARADLASKQARLDQVQQISRSGGNDQSVLEAVNSATIQGLRQKEAEIAGREAELRQRYFANHPSVQQVVREHEEVLTQIASEIARIKSSVSNEVVVARSRLAELESGLQSLEGGLVQANRAIVRLKELERDAEASSSVYRDFMLRAREIAAQETLKVVDARSVSRAIQPEDPSSISPTIWWAFFVGGGLFLALVGGIIRSNVNDRIVRPEAIPHRVGVPALVSVPLISQRQLRRLPPDERNPEDFLVNKPMTPFAESLRVLAASLISDHDERSARAGLSVAITSAIAAEGKTTISLSLGRVAAMSGLRVLLVDCDVRRPSLSASIGDMPAISLADVVRNGADWRQAAVSDPLTSAIVLPIHGVSDKTQSMFRPEFLRKLLLDLRPEFDLILMDCPPVLAVAETRWMTLVADTTIVVTNWNRTRTSAVRTAAREIRRAKGRVSGVVLNRIDVGMTKRFSFSDALYYGGAGKGYYAR